MTELEGLSIILWRQAVGQNHFVDLHLWSHLSAFLSDHTNYYGIHVFTSNVKLYKHK